MRSRAQIGAVFARGKSVSCSGMRLAYLPNGLPHNRIAVATARGFANAVARNRCRRHGKEAYRALKPDLAPGYDLVLVLYPGVYTFAERLNQESWLFARARLLADGLKES